MELALLYQRYSVNDMDINSGKIAQAKSAGYSDAEIMNYLGQDKALSSKITQARNAKYSDAEILDYLSKQAGQAQPQPRTPEFVQAAQQTVRPLKTLIRKAGEYSGLTQAGESIGKELAYQFPGKGVKQEVLEQAGLKPTTGERIGTGLEVGSLLLPYGKIAKGTEMLAGKVVSPALAKLIGASVSGATGGYTYEAGSKIRKGEAPTPGTLTAIGAIMPPALEVGAAKVSKLLNPNLNKTIEEGISKGIRPSVASRGQSAAQKASYFEKANNAVQSIIGNKENLVLTDTEGNTVKGVLPKSLNDFSQAIDQTKKSIFSQYDALAKAAGEKGATVDLAPVTKELNTIVNSKVLQDLSPEVVTYAKTRIENLTNRGTYTAQEAQDAIQNLNSSLQAFYKNPSYENASRAGVDAIIANNLRNSLDDVIEKTTGEGYQALKNQYGALKAIEKDVNRRATVSARQSPKGFFDLTDIVSGAELIRGIATMNPADVAYGTAMRGIKAWIKRQNDPNRIVSKMFTTADTIINKPEAVKGISPRFPGDIIADSLAASKIRAIQGSNFSTDVKKRFIDKIIKDQKGSVGRDINTVFNNASGESSASMEAISRNKTTRFFRIDTRTNKMAPIIGVDAVDARPGPYEVILQSGPKGSFVSDRGAKAEAVKGISPRFPGDMIADSLAASKIKAIQGSNFSADVKKKFIDKIIKDQKGSVGRDIEFVIPIKGTFTNAEWADNYVWTNKAKLAPREIPEKIIKYSHKLTHEPSEKTISEYISERTGFSDDPIIVTQDMVVVDGNGRLANTRYQNKKNINAIVLPWKSSTLDESTIPYADMHIAGIVYKMAGYDKRFDYFNYTHDFTDYGVEQVVEDFLKPKGWIKEKN